MTWFRTDDGWLMHPKVQAAGLHGRALWHAAGSAHCAAKDTDGVIDGRMLKALAALAGVPLSKAVDALVSCGLWHTPETLRGCQRCTETARNAGGLRDGDYFMHDFLECNLDKAGKNDPVHRDREARRNALRKDKRKVQLIRERDRDLCCYCGVLTKWGTSDRRGKTVGELEHLDPWGDNAMSNVRVACKGCNVEKGDRTPEQWVADGGLALRPFPVDPGPTQVNQTETSGEPTPDQPATGGLPRVARDSGPGQVGPGFGPGSAGADPGFGPGPGQGPSDPPSSEEN